ncbi:MAG: tyrosine-protein phosphatase [Sandaracinaceae bacterium]|nr:tyrosine-protein phosphatase [Sandaracinaceae bacterium]
MISLERLPNFRDAGDLPTAEGRRLRAGRLFRSELPSLLSARDRAVLAGLSIALVCDLRTARERRRRPATVLATARRAWVPLHEDPRYDVGVGDLARFLVAREGEARFRAVVARYYRHLVLERASQLGAVLLALPQREGASSWVHCTAGRDRTGLVVALVQRTLGVPEPRVLASYRETDERYAVRLERLARVLRAATLRTVSDARMHTVLRTQPEILGTVLGELVARHGSIEGYVRQACGVGEEDLRALGRWLLVP